MQPSFQLYLSALTLTEEKTFHLKRRMSDRLYVFELWCWKQTCAVWAVMSVLTQFAGLSSEAFVTLAASWTLQAIIAVTMVTAGGFKTTWTNWNTQRRCAVRLIKPIYTNNRHCWSWWRTFWVVSCFIPDNLHWSFTTKTVLHDKVSEIWS